MTDHTEQIATEPKAPVSRRGMLRYGALAAAAAAGAAGAAAAGSPAQAAPGDAITVDGANVGTGSTKLTGSNLAVTTSGSKPALVAVNESGPQLQLGGMKSATFPPTSGTFEVGAIVNWENQLFQCIESTGPNGQTVWRGLSNTGPVLWLLDQPTRVYASSADTAYNKAKIAHGQYRKIDTVTTMSGDASGVPPWASAVVGTVQLQATESTLGYLAVASGDVVQPAGYSTTVWSAANFAGVTSFTSALGNPANDDNRGTLSIACYGNSAASKTHFFVDIVGYYDYDLWAGGPDGLQRLDKAADKGFATRAKLNRTK